MYEVHKYMALDEKEIGWFVTQVGTSAASFGVSSDDVATVGKALLDTFGMKCSPPASVPATAAPALQAICIEVSLPEYDSVSNKTLSLTVRFSQPVQKQQCQHANTMDQSLSLRQPCKEVVVEVGGQSAEVGLMGRLGCSEILRSSRRNPKLYTTLYIYHDAHENL